MNKKFLIGFTEEKNVIYGEIEITWRNGFRELSLCFNECEPFIDEETNGEDYYEELISCCYTNDKKYELCEQYDCKPSELAREMAEAEGITYTSELKDCNSFLGNITINGDDYYFEHIRGGQMDIKEDCTITKYVNNKAVNKIYIYWKNYHLKEITEEQEKELAEIIKELPTEKEDIQELIKKELAR